MRSAMLRAVRAADIRQIIGKLVEMAKAGDIRATGLLLAHLLGRPKETVRVEERQFCNSTGMRCTGMANKTLI